MKKVLLAAALVLCASSAYAASDRFAQMDKDGNGQVDWKMCIRDSALPPFSRILYIFQPFCILALDVHKRQAFRSARGFPWVRHP